MDLGRKLSMNFFSQSFFNRPTIPHDSHAKSASFNSIPFCPFGNSQIFTGEVDAYRIRSWPFVLIIAATCRPATIARFIISVVVWVSVQLQSGRTLAHVAKERSKAIFPFITHRNPAPAIISIVFIVWIEVSLFSVMPSSVFYASTASMFFHTEENTLWR